MPVIESDDYRREQEVLRADPIVVEMADELRPEWERRAAGPGNGLAIFVHPDDHQPRWNFMGRCNDEYRKRGGENARTIGAVARAVIALVKADA